MLSIVNEVDLLIFRYVCFVCDTNMLFPTTCPPCGPYNSSKTRDWVYLHTHTYFILPYKRKIK